MKVQRSVTQRWALPQIQVLIAAASVVARIPRSGRSHAPATACVAFGVACISASFTHAGSISVSFQESGSDVVASFSGSVDLADALGQPTPQSDGPAAGMIPAAGVFVSMAATNYNFWVFAGDVVPFSPSGGATATSQTGDSFGFGTYPAPPFPLFYLPTTYTSGSALSGTMTFASQTFSSLGLTSGTYSWATIGSSPNTVTITIPQSIPEPATYAMALAGLACGGYTMYRRRKRA